MVCPHGQISQDTTHITQLIGHILTPNHLNPPYQSPFFNETLFLGRVYWIIWAELWVGYQNMGYKLRKMDKSHFNKPKTISTIFWEIWCYLKNQNRLNLPQKSDKLNWTNW